MTSAPLPPEPNFSHLIAMTDERGTFEHALFREPRPQHGYCTDDMARVLVVATREPYATPGLRHLAVLSLRFLLEALEPQGKCRNRMNRVGTWNDPPALDDCWGRCILGLGTAVSQSDDDVIRHRATRGLVQATRGRSTWPKAMAFAATWGGRMAQRQSGQRVGANPAGRRRRFDDDGQRRCRVAMARATSHVRQCHAPRGHDCRRVGASSSGPREAWVGALGMAARARDATRTSLGHPCRRQRPRRPLSKIRPTTDRGGRHGRCVCTRHDR